MWSKLLYISTLLTKSYDNMNGDVYDISNRDLLSSVKFPTIFTNINSSYEYFDVYSPPITSRYGDVYWTMMDTVKLPQNIINRFRGKTMAIVGYEQDQVFKNDISVPITWSYNHHYEAYLLGSKSTLMNVSHNLLNKDDYGQYNHGSKALYKPISLGYTKNNIPDSQFFSEANGGESRISFHGYPRGMAQLIYSPESFSVQPMQIDTRNRDPRFINSSKFVPGLMPKQSASPENANYSGLLECPCTDRINKQIIHNYDTLTNGRCNELINNESICYHQVLTKLNISKFNKNITIKNSKLIPSGCSFNTNKNLQLEDIFYNNYSSNTSCGINSTLFYGNIYDKLTDINVSLLLNSLNYRDEDRNVNGDVIINISGPANVWFGIGFNATSMANLPYTIVSDGLGNVYEVKLGNHNPGIRLNNSLKILSNVVNGSRRTLSISRDIKGLNDNYYSFNKEQSTLNLINAIGSQVKFSYHHLRSANTLSINSLDGNTCLCDSGKSSYINGIPFVKNCAEEPVGDLIKQKNPTCFIDTYQGGLACCHHKNILLDKGQNQPEHTMTYRLKFRFWFQDYNNQKNLIRPYFQTESYAGEYDVPKCSEGTPSQECIHSITGHWQVKDMVDQKVLEGNKGIKLIYAGPHCHAPTCISMELYNSDTGDLICRAVPRYGKGNVTKKYDEKDYITIDPCIWGYEEGLINPMKLSWDTNLTSIKKNNNTYAHYGEMASWQCRAVIF